MRLVAFVQNALLRAFSLRQYIADQLGRMSKQLSQRIKEDGNTETFWNTLQIPPDSVDLEILHDATRREARGNT